MWELRMSLVTVLLAVAGAANALAAGKHDGTYLHKITTAVVTPHLAWARPLAGGKLRTLFIVPRNLAAREVVELTQRLDLDMEAFVARHAGVIAEDNIYEAAVSGTSVYAKTQELLGKLEPRYDVIVLGNVDFKALPVEARYRVLRQVAEGAGLLIVYPRRMIYKKVVAKPVPARDEILRLVSLPGLPKAVQSLTPDKLINTYRFGKGRVAQVGYGSYHSAYWGGLSLSAPEAYSSFWKARYENNMVLVARALIWASGRKADMTVQSQSFTSAEPLAQDVPANESLSFTIAGAPGKATLHIRLRDAWNTVVQEKDCPVTVAQEPVTVIWKRPFLKDGLHSLDVILRTDKGVADFGFFTFAVASGLGQVKLTTSKASYEKGEPIQGTLVLEKPLAAAGHLRLTLADSPYRRVWHEEEVPLPAGQKKTTFTVKPLPLPTIAGCLNAEVTSDKGVLHKSQAVLYFPQRKLEVFPTLAWNCVPEQFLSPFYAQQVVEALDWRAGLSHPSKEGNNARVAALFDQRFVPYMTRICLGPHKDKPGWTSQYNWFFLNKKQKEEVKALGGDESFYNPKAKALWKQGIINRIKNLPLYGPMIYTLGDENHFGYNIGFSPSDEKAFRIYLRQRYGTIEKLNQEWETAFASFDAVKHYTEKEAREGKRFAAWYDHRQFVEHEYADIHHYLAQCIKEIDPQARVGAEGSVPGDLEYTINKLEFWGPYSNPVMDEVLRSLGRDKIRMLWWGGYVGSHGGRDQYPIPLWRPLLQGTVNGSAWFAAGVSSEGMLGADFSHAKYFQELWPHLAELQGGLAQLLITTPLEQDGIAIHWSHASMSAALMDERFFNPKASIHPLLELCYQRGLNFDFVSTRMIEAGELRHHKILFLFGASAISDKEKQEIQTFVENGGTVVADLNPGILNRFCRPLDRSQLGELFDATALKGEKKFELKAVAVDTTVKGKPVRFAATKAYISAEVEPMRVKKTGKGVAVLLGFGLGAAKSSAHEGAMNAFLLDLLSAAGIQPRCQVTGLTEERQIVRLRQGHGYAVLGILARSQDVGRNLHVTWPEKAFVYRAGHGLLGEKQTWTETLSKPLAVYCLFADKQSAPLLKLDRTDLRCGEVVKLDVSTLPLGAVLRLEVLDPAGKALPLRQRVLIVRAQAKPESIAFACNDAPGAYALKLTDVRTGLQTTERVNVK